MKHYWVSFLCLYVLSINASSTSRERKMLSPRQIMKLVENKSLANENSQRCCVENAILLFRLSNTNMWKRVGTIADCNRNDKDYIQDGYCLYVPSFEVVPIEAFGGMRIPVAALIIGTNDKNAIDLCREALIPEERDVLRDRSQSESKDEEEFVEQKKEKVKSPRKEESVIMRKKRKNKVERRIKW